MSKVWRRIFEMSRESRAQCVFLSFDTLKRHKKTHAFYLVQKLRDDFLSTKIRGNKVQKKMMEKKHLHHARWRFDARNREKNKYFQKFGWREIVKYRDRVRRLIYFFNPHPVPLVSSLDRLHVLCFTKSQLYIEELWQEHVFRGICESESHLVFCFFLFFTHITSPPACH